VIPQSRGAPMSTDESVKAKAHDLVDRLPESASWDDLMYEIYVRQAIEAGISDADAGRTVPHDMVKGRLSSRRIASSTG